MPVDLTAIRALLTSTSGAAGPWRLVDVGEDTGRVRILDADNEDVIYIGDDGRWEALELDLIAAAPTLHAHLTDLVGEVERLRAHNARMAAALRDMANSVSGDGSAGGWDAAAEALMLTLSPDGSWEDAAGSLRALAAGEVDDG